ncbi:MAG: hypothetical protein ACREUY_03880, partial [Burkholderiales bacterium]
AGLTSWGGCFRENIISRRLPDCKHFLRGSDMLKLKEIDSLDSCLSRAYENEMIFVLMARDPAAPNTIRDWVRWRLAYGKNETGDPQIEEALRCADVMEMQCPIIEVYEAGDPDDAPFCRALTGDGYAQP